jgi:hypothetical protein
VVISDGCDCGIDGGGEGGGKGGGHWVTKTDYYT